MVQHILTQSIYQARGRDVLKVFGRRSKVDSVVVDLWQGLTLVSEVPGLR